MQLSQAVATRSGRSNLTAAAAKQAEPFFVGDLQRQERRNMIIKPPLHRQQQHHQHLMTEVKGISKNWAQTFFCVFLPRSAVGLTQRRDFQNILSISFKIFNLT